MNIIPSEVSNNRIHDEPLVLSWRFTFKWVAAFLGTTVFITLPTSHAAHYLMSSSEERRFVGFAVLQMSSLLVPIAAILCFAILSRATGRPFVRAGSVYLWSFTISAALSILSENLFHSVFRWVVFTLPSAVVGAIAGVLWNRYKPLSDGLPLKGSRKNAPLFNINRIKILLLPVGLGVLAVPTILVVYGVATGVNTFGSLDVFIKYGALPLVGFVVVYGLMKHAAYRVRQDQGFMEMAGRVRRSSIAIFDLQRRRCSAILEWIVSLPRYVKHWMLSVVAALVLFQIFMKSASLTPDYQIPLYVINGLWIVLAAGLIRTLLSLVDRHSYLDLPAKISLIVTLLFLSVFYSVLSLMVSSIK